MQEDKIKATSRNVIRELSERHDFFFKKDLGQNFLADENIVEKIVASLEPSKDEVAVEVGPGMGSLTQKLSRDFSKVYCVEIDTRAVQMLEETLEGCDNVTIVNADFLKTNLSELLSEETESKKTLKFISNLPYYITSPIIMKVLESEVEFERLVVMTQKEVADRLSAPIGTKNYSSFTVMVNYHADVNRLFTVSRNVFVPAPKVDSCVLEIVPRKMDNLEVTDEKLFSKVVRAAFLNRRKKVLNSLSNNLPYDKNTLAGAMSTAGIDSSARAENISIEKFAALSEALKASKKQQ